MQIVTSRPPSLARSRFRRLVEAALLAAVVGVSATGCTQTQPEESLAADGVLGCADSATWGRVTTVTPGVNDLRVILHVDRWVVPDKGADTVEFVADNPSSQAGAPTWATGDRGLLVLNRSSPPSLFTEDAGKEIEKAWRDAGARCLTDCQA